MDDEINSWKEKQILKSHQDPLAQAKCPLCPYGFRLEASLSAHIAALHNSSYECSSCEQKFANATKLTSHRRLEHAGERNKINAKRRMETPSDETVASFILRQINTTLGQILYKCKECDKEFRRHDTIVGHAKRVHLRVKAFECSLCQASFMTSEWLRKHKASSHGIKILSNKEKRAQLLKDMKKYYDLDGQDQPVLMCNQCQKSYNDLSQLQRHIKVIHVKKQVVICDLCGKHLSSRASLKEHVLWFHGVGDERKILRKRLWDTYGEWTDPPENKIKCKVCGTVVKGLVIQLANFLIALILWKILNKVVLFFLLFQFSTLKRHVEDVHERNFQFHCEKCGQTFHNKANFKTHMFKQHKIERSSVIIPKNDESVVLAAMAKRLFVQIDEGTKIHCIECKQSYHKR